MKKAIKSALCIITMTLFTVILIGTGCINSMMFHPVKGGYSENTPGYVDVGTNGVRVAAFVLGPEHGKKALIRCHGNAEDMVNTLWNLGELAKRGYTVAAVDYPGYGLSDGSPDEKGCYRNVHRLYDWLIEKRGFKPEDIFVDGFSIGTGPATELAATRTVGGLILEAPFLSAPRVVTRIRILPIDPFPNIDRIADVKCPIAIIHGTADEIVPYSQGRELYERAKEPKRLISVAGGDHNYLPVHFGKDKYLDFIVSFIAEWSDRGDLKP